MRTRPLKACARCLEVRHLCDSHLIPASMLRLLRSDTLPTANPIHVSDTHHYTPSKPLIDYLLCEECEDLFRTRGEEWVAQNCQRSSDTFKLRDALLRHDYEIASDGVAKLYRASSIPEIQTDHLVYFGLSVIWRAGVHDWRAGHKTLHLELGPYLEPLRQFLRDEAAFPEGMVLAVSVSSIDYFPVVNNPESQKASGFRVHGFTVPGLNFLLFVGKILDVDRRHSTAPSPGRYIGIAPSLDHEHLTTALGRYSKAVEQDSAKHGEKSKLPALGFGCHNQRGPNIT